MGKIRQVPSVVGADSTLISRRLATKRCTQDKDDGEVDTFMSMYIYIIILCARLTHHGVYSRVAFTQHLQLCDSREVSVRAHGNIVNSLPTNDGKCRHELP